MRKYLTIVIISLGLLLVGCTQADNNAVSYTGKIADIDQFGNVITDIAVEDFEKLGFAYGDSLNVSFENGYKLEDTPYYNSFYGDHGDEIVTRTHTAVSFAKISGNFADASKVKKGESVNITLCETGKYSELMDLYYLTSTIERIDNQTDAEFANMRSISVGSIKSGILHRSGSPFDPYYCRTEIVSDYIAQNNIHTIIDLADDEEDFAEYDNLTTVAAEKYTSGRVFLCPFGADYADEETQEAEAKIIRIINSEDGPYIVHCSIGQDRTGLICALLEGMCGASYDEILEDYMLSYSNLYGFTKESNPDKYELMSRRLIYMLKLITGSDDPSKLSAEQIKKMTNKYLKKIGLSDSEIQTAVNKLCK